MTTKRILKKNSNAKNYTTIYFGLAPKQAKKLEKSARKQGKTESGVLRQILDVYLKHVELHGLSYKPFKRTKPVGMKVLPRTVRKDQDEKLRHLAEKTGISISQLAREAVQKYCGKENSAFQSKLPHI